jgi:NAD(P)-dependent dehydrogenase (short-subunit alcohol dehydrogenase family)
VTLDGVVIVTGAGSGIGRALALEAAGRGATTLALVDLDREAAAAVAQSLGDEVTAVAYGCDVADIDAVEDLADRVVKDLGQPTLVCANAGVSPPTSGLLDTDPAVLRWVLEVNVLGTWATLRSFGRRLVVGTTPGWLLVTGSEHSLGVPFLGQGAYTASKHAVMAMADVLHGELPQHVGLSILVPGLVASNLWRGLERRPARFGGEGPADEMARVVIDRGMAADQVAVAAFDGIERRSFVIATHNHARRYAEERYADVTEGFDQLDATGIPALSYAVDEVVASILDGSVP